MTMQAGVYYIGDLCYVMHPEWDEFCDITADRLSVIDGEFHLADGRAFATYTTAYGDGVYPASNNAKLGVDAGLIGCIRLEDISEKLSFEELIDRGTVVVFNEPFETGKRKDGTIYFGDFSVYTGSDDEEDDDYDY